MNPVTGATPLVALEAIAIDTETTGLDTTTARIVEIAAVGVSHDRVKADDSIDLLTNPGIPIPPQATAIHGIKDEIIRDAPAFPEVFERFLRFAGKRVLIGHSIGFDLAVLEGETARAGLQWKRPRSLCVRLLTSLLDPVLPDYSLDTIAAWLQIPIAQRHRALGDAMTAAHIFVALLPKLRASNIRTLGEAERACLRLSSLVEEGRRAGWAEAVSMPMETGPYQTVDPYAYRHRVRDVMSEAPVIVSDRTSLAEGLAIMTERKIGSLLVSNSDEAGQPIASYAIATERDVMRKLAAEKAAAFSAELASLASRPLASIQAGSFVYRAVGRMQRLNIRHLAVCDDEGQLVGIVSARDLLGLRASQASGLGDAIEAAQSASELAAAWATLPCVADGLIEDGVDARVTAEVISDELRALTRRAATLAHNQMIKDGAGPQPCRYAVMVLGSGGRGESLLAADQDNAFIYERGDPDGQEDRWFAELGTRLANLLDIAGVPYCKGGVMAKNAEWRGSVHLWKQRVEGWVKHSRPKDLLNVDIFFDLRPVHGERRLATNLLDHAYACASNDVDFAKSLGEQVSSVGNPFTPFGGLRTHGGRIHLKLHGLFPIVSFARALAIRHDIRVHSTKQRLERLIDLNIGAERDLAGLISAHALILRHLIAQQSRDLHAGIPVSNQVDIRRLDRVQVGELRSALKCVRTIPGLLMDLMF